MAQLIFAQAKSIRKKALKECNKLPLTYNELGYPTIDNNAHNDTYNHIIEKERAEFRKILEIAKLLHEDYTELTGNTTNNWYFVTIRPKHDTNFKTFITYIEKYIQRAFIIDYTLSLEQKSITGSGEGFHCHIVCNTKHRSKGEILRDTLSTFNKICEPQCIQIDTTRNPQKIINAYLIAYESEDKHKEITKEGDATWRAKYNILPLYNKKEQPFSALSIKSDETVQKSINPFIIEMD